MAHEGGYYRLLLLNLFMFFMRWLVLGANFLLMFRLKAWVLLVPAVGFSF
jgi:hypothetical protein